MNPGPSRPPPQRWLGPTRHWVSATPVVHERFLRKGPDLNEITRWCEHAGVAARPVSFRIARPPLLDGAISLHPSEVVREGRERRPYSHLEVLFEEPVLGPVVLGAARQFGFGLMFPVDSRSDSGA
ncbi:MAG: type I-U CRISPR-associated protein Csb2 [Acidimicrobiia bacterium]|nr:type I-U CRISPR-associated protein Csb2 [Acidimicrobiia bacterium]